MTRLLRYLAIGVLLCGLGQGVQAATGAEAEQSSAPLPASIGHDVDLPLRLFPGSQHTDEITTLAQRPLRRRGNRIRDCRWWAVHCFCFDEFLGYHRKFSDQLCKDLPRPGGGIWLWIRNILGVLGGQFQGGQIELSSDEAAAAAAVIASVLVAAGIAVSVAQAVATAIANAVQAGVDVTTQDILDAIGGRPTHQPPAPPRPPVARPPPLIDPRDGQPLQVNAKGQVWAPDKKGNWRWLSRAQAERAVAALEREVEQRRRDATAFERESDDRRKELKKRAKEQIEAERRKEAEIRRGEAERRAAIDDIDRIRKAAEHMGLDEILARSHHGQIYNDDGSVNIDYVNRLKGALRSRLSRDLAMPDHKLGRTSTVDILQDAAHHGFKDASNSFWKRAILGVATKGWSEAVFQSGTTLQAVQTSVHRAVDQGKDFTSTDVLNTVTGEFVRENLPVNTVDALVRMRRGEKVSWTELGVSMFADAAAGLDIAEVAGVEPGAALDSVAKRVLDAETHANLKRGISDMTTAVSERVNALNKTGTEAIESALDGIGLGGSGRLTPDGGSHRLTPDLAETRFNEAQLSAETERIAAETRDSGVTREMDDHFESGRAAGREKVEALSRSIEELEAARASGTATPDQIAALERQMREDVLRVQADKHAMNELNRLPKTDGENAVIKEFNGEMDAIYEQADRGTKARLAEEYGVRPEDVQVVTITNMPGEAGMKIDPRAPPRENWGHASHWEPDGGVTGSRAEASRGSAADTTGTGPSQSPADAAQAAREPKGNKASFDRDLTMRVRTVDPHTGRVIMEDVPSTTTARIYNEELYKAAKGVDDAPTPSRQPRAEMAAQQSSVDFKDTHLSPSEHLADPNDILDADKLAKRLDQATTDRLHPEAYGTGQGDLDTATKDAYRGRDFIDPAVTAKTVEFKVNHWMKEADELKRAAASASTPGQKQKLLEAAVALEEEAQRQLVKQYGNMVVTRTRAMQALGNAPGATIPRSLSEGVNVLKQVQTGHLTPAQAEAVLARMGTGTEQLAGQMSAYVEGLQKLRGGGAPVPGAAAPGATASTPKLVVKGWRDEFQTDQQQP
ncbi:MAG: hypothetical protein QNJ94_19540 [Alphaproteobacteria bacterium]|nr:hypothetical protein [Alphaproteobacteria bacterium]